MGSQTRQILYSADVAHGPCASFVVLPRRVPHSAERCGQNASKLVRIPQTIEALRSTPPNDRSRQSSDARYLLPLAVLLSLFGLCLFVVAPFRQTLWIIHQVETVGRSSVRTEPGGPDWLRDTLGEHWTQGFDEITRLSLHVDGRFDTARLLAYLKPHARVESLSLNTPTASDDGFGRLDCLPNLQTLRLEGGVLTDDGMQHLRRCEWLTTLQLTGLTITDAGIDPIESLTSLEELHIRECPGVTDEAMQHLTHADSVTQLRLSGQGFTDESIQHLAGMKQLKTLDVVDTAITADGATRLFESVPQCTVIWSEEGKTFTNRITNMLGF